MRRTILRAGFLIAVTIAVGLALGVQRAQPADSPACTAAKNRVANDERGIAKANKNLAFKNPHKDIEAIREKQLNRQIARLQADLVVAKAAQHKACGTSAPSLSAYDGTYSGMFGRIGITFTVANGIISGDLLNPSPLRAMDPKTGIAWAQANFVGADCDTFAVQFNAAAGTATVTDLKCTLSGQTETHTVVAARKK
ncbi:MAG: hypothetical protein ABSB24_15955 [Gaiellaceae bacterium]|jgi:hypothetical protein